MDDIDFTLSMILMGNSRISFKDLSKMFSMSVNSIHKRVKSLVELGVIQNFKTRLSIYFFSNVVNVIMFGTPKSSNVKDLISKLGENEFIYNVARASGNIFFIHAYIRNLNELDSLVSFVRSIGEIDDLIVGLEKQEQSTTLTDIERTKVDSLDYLIINSLKDNSRKTVVDIAGELGLNVKTIRRHLDMLIEKNLIIFTIDWYPDKTGETLSFIILNLDPLLNPVDLNLTENLRKKFGANFVFLWEFSNLPNMKLLCVWFQSMKQLQEIENQLLIDTIFESIKVLVLLEGENFPTWINFYLEGKVREIRSN
ncbi:MAG: winged helix-turn-helix transcriptional regulator [Candidatus Lokiarchaeota archaeon]|nr:winged helix-turn-helix transcriptional regulator [Candidatus Lokiarchaeota archaeon]